MAHRVAREVELGPSSASNSKGKQIQAAGQALGKEGKEGGVGGKGDMGGIGGMVRKMDEEEERDAVFFRLEILGYRVGQGLVERCV